MRDSLGNCHNRAVRTHVENQFDAIENNIERARKNYKIRDHSNSAIINCLSFSFAAVIVFGILASVSGSQISVS